MQNFEILIYFKDLSILVHAMVVNGAAKKNGAKFESADWLTESILLLLMVYMIKLIMLLDF